MTEPTRRQRRKDLTDKMVAALPRKRKRYITADPELRGHYVRVPPQGPACSPPSRATPYGKQVWATLGTTAELTIEQPATRRARPSSASRRAAGLRAAAGAAGQRGRRVRDWLKRHVEAKGLRTGDELKRVLEKYVLPVGATAPLRASGAATLPRCWTRRGQARPWVADERAGRAAQRVVVVRHAATTITCRPSSRICGASRRRPASAAAS